MDSAMLLGFAACLRGTGPLYAPYAPSLVTCADWCMGTQACRAFEWRNGTCALFSGSDAGDSAHCWAQRYASPERETAMSMRTRTNELRAKLFRIPLVGQLAHYVYNTAMEIDQLVRDTRPAYALNPATWASVAYTLQRWEEAGIAEYDDVTVERVRHHFELMASTVDSPLLARHTFRLCAFPYEDTGFEYCPANIVDVHAARAYVASHCAIESQFVVDTTRSNVTVVHVGGTEVDNGWEIDVSARNDDGELCAMPTGDGDVHCGFLDIAQRILHQLTSSGTPFLERARAGVPTEWIAVSQGTSVIPILLLLLRSYVRDVLDVPLRVQNAWLWSPVPMGDDDMVRAYGHAYDNVTHVYAHGNDFIALLTPALLGIRHVDATQSTVEYDVAHCTGRWSDCVAQCDTLALPRCVNLAILAGTLYPHTAWLSTGAAFTEAERLQYVIGAPGADRAVIFSARPMRYTTMCLPRLYARFRYKDMCEESDGYNSFYALAVEESHELHAWCDRSVNATMHPRLCC